jgi:hypothetical protein
MQQEEDLKQIAEYGLVDFCRRTDELYKQGYKFDFENSLRVPCSYGSLFEAILVKLIDVEPEVQLEVQPRQRKSKSIE